MNTKPLTLSHKLALAVLKAVVFTAAFGVTAAALPDASSTMVIGGVADRDVMELRETAPESPEAMLAKHLDQCWTGSMAPKADLPGHALVQFNDGRTVKTGAPELVDSAFSEALGESDDPELEVIALCV